MSAGPPKLIAIEHDDYHAQHVGRTRDGRQFFLTTPFEPAIAGRPGGEFVAIFLFDLSGQLLSAKIDSFGPRASMDREKRREACERYLRELGDIEYGRIEVAPFVVERFDISFGLIPRPGETEDDSWWVEMLPGNYMAFHEPWDSGEYDT